MSPDFDYEELAECLLVIADWLDNNKGPMMAPETCREAADALRHVLAQTE